MSELEKSLNSDVRTFDVYKNIIHQKSGSYSSKYSLLKLYKEQLVNLKYLEGILEKRENELRIITHFNIVLNSVTKETYWVFNIKDTETYKALYKERRAQEALYRRKIKQLNHRLSSFKLSLSLIHRDSEFWG